MFTGKDQGTTHRINNTTHNILHNLAPNNRVKKRLTSRISRMQNDTLIVSFKSQSVKVAKTSEPDIIKPFKF